MLSWINAFHEQTLAFRKLNSLDSMKKKNVTVHILSATTRKVKNHAFTVSLQTPPSPLVSFSSIDCWFVGVLPLCADEWASVELLAAIQRILLSS